MASASSPSATGSSILALPTPFAQLATCTDIFSTSVLTVTVYDRYTQSHSTATTATVTVSDPADPRFTTCQPPGWADVAPESRFTFSPAVCPGGWTAYSLRSESQVSTAYCCARYLPPMHLHTFSGLCDTDLPRRLSSGPPAAILWLMPNGRP